MRSKKPVFGGWHVGLFWWGTLKAFTILRIYDPDPYHRDDLVVLSLIAFGAELRFFRPDPEDELT